MTATPAHSGLPTFAQLGLPTPFVRALAARGVTTPFPVQAAAIPDALDGRDVSGKAPTGSGKTLAFGLPVLARVPQAGKNRPQALILAPTRELAEQIRAELAPLAEAAGRRVAAIYGGVSYGPQRAALRRGADVLVATPGRLEDLLEQRDVDLGEVGIAVIDEADRMADMGFMPAVRRILDRTAKRRQTLLFSATLDGDVAVLSRDYQRNPVRHDAAPVEPDTVDAEHRFWLVEHQERARHAAEVVAAAGRTIVFTRTRRGADRLATRFAKFDVDAVALHGGRTQGQRTRALRDFTTGKAQALIATDVAARGIHVDAVAAVVHFDPPADHKAYLHRSGRTARAGAAGTIVSLVTGDQRRGARRMQRDLGLDVPIGAPDLGGIDHMAPPPPPVAAPRRPATKRAHRPARPKPGAHQSLYVANLPWSTTAAELASLFAAHGEVHASTIITDRSSGRSRGFGFVDMAPADADHAVGALHGSRLDGRDLTVRPARPRS